MNSAPAHNGHWPTSLVEKASLLWETIEELSAMLWDMFGDDFIEMDQMRANRRQEILSDSLDEPF